MERVLDLEVPVVTKGQVAPDAVDYARLKIAHAARHGSAPALHAVVRLTQAADPAQVRPAIAEATLDLGGSIVRAHVAATTMLEAIDLLDERLRRRIDEGEDRRRALHLRHRDDGPGEWRHGSVPSERPHRFERPVEDRELLRHKSFAVAQQTVDEAVLDLEALDHDFFLFRDERTGCDAVLWRRNAHYALIESDGEGGAAPDTVAEVEVERRPVERLSVEEAIEHLDLVSEPFVFFVNAATGRGNVAYLRYDGHYGLIEPAG